MVKVARIISLFVMLPLYCVAQNSEVFQSKLPTDQKPWTHLNFANDPEDFQFAIISDRTGGPRAGVFEEAIEKLNWLMPEFVMSVGDLIRGAKGSDSVELDKQWTAHFDRIAPLKMPFFHLAGNHDIKANNAFQVAYWNKLFGTTYYAFVYKDVLFLNLFSNQGTQVLFPEQVAYAAQVLAENKDVRWTMVFLHHPLWRYPHMSNFHKIEEMLQDRKHTVFAGHQHQYHHAERNNGNYYVLATTGGGSPLLGNSFGSFDHLTWVTMSEEGPIVTNLRLDGILAHDVANDETHLLTQQLLQSTQVKTDVFVDDSTAVKSGRAYISYRNTSDQALEVEGRFFHHHQLTITPSRFRQVIAPHTTESIDFSIQAIHPFPTHKKVQLAYTSTIAYQDSDYPDLSLSGQKVLPIEMSSYPLFPTQEVEFVGSYEVKMADPLPGTIIRYTLDGSEPTPSSKRYEKPFSIQKSTSLTACLFTEEAEMKSNPVTMDAEKVPAGQGLMVAHYPYSLESRIHGGLPDFSAYQPLKITTTKELDPVEVAGREEQFALVYHGLLEVEESGIHTLTASSDDGIRLFINDQEVLSDPVKHKQREVKGQIDLTAGRHPIEIQYFQWKRNYAMDITLTTPSGKTKELGAEMLSYDQNTLKNEK